MLVMIYNANFNCNIWYLIHSWKNCIFVNPVLTKCAHYFCEENEHTLSHIKMGKYHLLIITAWICVSFFWKIKIKIVHSVFHRVHFCRIYDLINLDIVCFGLNKYMLYTTITYEIMMFGNYPLNDFFVIILEFKSLQMIIERLTW